MLNTRYSYKLSKDQTVILDEIMTNRQMESTAYFHMAGEMCPARQAKIRYDKRGEGFFMCKKQRVYLNDMRMC